ncbi:putative cystathionine gamma-synthase/beta-lyase [Dichotomopilus funicola]|uniref:Cystathionine gamma-synthase/beta-lyase n=1 Tax=Dichotomopilus funicola TaxID=1934379 RepID=A0AAN6ZIS1_9PEZI|nr:putative cystathionine gamma-synthase/beta-lyase [Dichotomopilus funicola]
MATIGNPENLTLGTSLPPGNPHGVSVHLPKWADTVGWASREQRVLDAMNTGYPRFFMPRIAHQLAARLLELRRKAENGPEDGTQPGKMAMLLDSARHARMCLDALPKWETIGRELGPGEIEGYVVTWNGQITPLQDRGYPEEREESPALGKEDILLVAYPQDLAQPAKAFWQHTGFGISSRRASYWLEHAPFLTGKSTSSATNAFATAATVNTAREAIKNRIAEGYSLPSQDLHVSPSDIFLFPTGMTAITETAHALKSLRPADPSKPYHAVVFGFPYVDTFKTLLHTHPHPFTLTLLPSTPSALTDLAHRLITDPTFHPDALFTEVPGNPLLQTPDLHTLFQLSREHNFVLVVDDTIGTYVSLGLLPECDVVCTSLTKMFSGACDVMGGSVVLNPRGRVYSALRSALSREREETDRAWFGEDVLVMERNSRDFKERMGKASGNAEVVVGMLRASQVVREVFYPLGSETQEGYDRYRVEGGGYGFLLSVKFARAEQAVAFYDALDVAKGPSLGTNFTLCCAYTLLAHYRELAWAAEYGVVEDLVRISVGLEDVEWLRERVGRALAAAQEAGTVGV